MFCLTSFLPDWRLQELKNCKTVLCLIQQQASRFWSCSGSDPTNHSHLISARIGPHCNSVHFIPGIRCTMLRAIEPINCVLSRTLRKIKPIQCAVHPFMWCDLIADICRMDVLHNHHVFLFGSVIPILNKDERTDEVGAYVINLKFERPFNIKW